MFYVYIDCGDSFYQMTTDYKPQSLIRFWQKTAHQGLNNISDLMLCLLSKRTKLNRLSGPLGDFAEGVYDAVLVLRDESSYLRVGEKVYTPEVYLSENSPLEYL